MQAVGSVDVALDTPWLALTKSLAHLECLIPAFLLDEHVRLEADDFHHVRRVFAQVLQLGKGVLYHAQLKEAPGYFRVVYHQLRELCRNPLAFPLFLGNR